MSEVASAVSVRSLAASSEARPSQSEAQRAARETLSNFFDAASEQHSPASRSPLPARDRAGPPRTE